MVAEEKIQQLNTEKIDLPNITGKQVCHKKFGVGSVLLCENGRIRVLFPVKEMTFQYPQAFVNGFLTCGDIDETIYRKNGEIDPALSDRFCEYAILSALGGYVSMLEKRVCCREEISLDSCKDMVQQLIFRSLRP